MKTTTRLIAVTAALTVFIAPAMAEDHVNSTLEETVDEVRDEIEEENLTEVVINRSEAVKTARQRLSDLEWKLVDSSIDDEDGEYEFRFEAGSDSEAEVNVNASSGDIIDVEEEIESEGDKEDQVEQLERVEVENLEQAKDRINELRNMVMDLRRQVAELEQPENRRGERERGNSEIEVEKEDGETEVEGETPNGTEFEFESDSNASEEARENINGTPGSETAQENRPGFVSRMLNSIFG